MNVCPATRLSLKFLSSFDSLCHLPVYIPSPLLFNEGFYPSSSFLGAASILTLFASISLFIWIMPSKSQTLSLPSGSCFTEVLSCLGRSAQTLSILHKPRSHPKARKFSAESRRSLTSNTDTAVSSHAQPMCIISDSNLSPASHIQADSRRSFLLSEGFLVHPHGQALIWDPSEEQNTMVLRTSVTFCSLIEASAAGSALGGE